MSKYYYAQQEAGERVWKPLQTSQLGEILAEKPVFVTVLAVSRIIDESLTYEDKLKLAYMGPLYFDWDSSDELKVIEKVNQFLDKLVEMKVNLESCRLYATGGRGYHLEIPPEVFIAKLPKDGVIGLPAIYREMAMALAVDTLDLMIYSGGRGRMWRVPNVQRDNGRFKVQVTVEEMRTMTPDMCLTLTSRTRDPLPVQSPVYTTDLAIAYDTAQQKVSDLLKKRAKFKPDPNATKKAAGISIEMAMAGIGLKDGLGFQNIALQLAVCAGTAQIEENVFIERCQGLISSHQSDSNRYASEAKREEELRRMYRYAYGNMCYEFSIGAIKSLLVHSAPDLDDMKVTKEEMEVVIKEAREDALEEGEQDEYGDVARGVTLARHGIYKSTENGLKRICAVAFSNSSVLRSAETCQIVGYETDVMVNGTAVGRQTLELDVFSGLVPFNRFAAKYGHAFQGTDAEVRTVMMRFVEQAKKKGTTMYVMKREGLDVVSIPHHEDPLYHTPFLVWADGKGVITSPDIASTELGLKFVGYPDPRGVFKTDIGQAPALTEWLKEEGNKASLAKTLECWMTCQKPELMAKLIGWYVSCFYKQIFQKVYGKFPLLHVNGAAGVGKTENQVLASALFYYQHEPRLTSPSSTAFALQQQMTSSASIPLIVDEYKPHEMGVDLRNKFKLLFRDAYNQRPVTRGGGTRESEDYRALHETELAAPLVFIAEAAEDEAAVMERVVLATFSRPPQATGLKWLAKFQLVRRNHTQLGILGQYLAAQIINTVSLESFRDEFDAMYEVSKERYMLNEKDLGNAALSAEEMHNKQNAKERSVYNHTVAKFGFSKFRALVNGALDSQLDTLMGGLEDSIFDRMSDLHAATTPEHIKVLAEMCAMSYAVASDSHQAIRVNEEYAFAAGERIEIAVKTAYMRYASYMRTSGGKPLYNSAESFMHSVRESPAFVKQGTGEELGQPGVYIFSIDELAKYGVDQFNTKIKLT